MTVSKVTTYDSPNSIREDLSNIIYDISPTDTPFMSNIGRDTCENTYFEWQTDALAAANTSNAAIEGAAAGDADFTATVRVANYTQISTKVIAVSGTDDAVNNAGMRTQMAYQTAKAAKELKRDMEAILTSNQAGNIVLEIDDKIIDVYVQNEKFAKKQHENPVRNSQGYYGLWRYSG